MLKNRASYPYPLIREKTIDYCKTCFRNLISVRATSDGFVLSLKFSVNNDHLQTLLNEEILKYAVFITCKSTLFRKMIFVSPNEKQIKINASDVHNDVKCVAYIIAAKNIEKFEDDDFSEDYKGLTYRINSGDIIGIGHEIRFKALYDKNLISDSSSIFTLRSDEKKEYMSFDFDCDHIEIILPKDMHLSYSSCRSDKRKYPVINSLVVLPALIEAIRLIDGDSENERYSCRPWSISLQSLIKKISEKKKLSEKNLYEDPLKTAQIILQNFLANALKYVSDQ